MANTYFNTNILTFEYAGNGLQIIDIVYEWWNSLVTGEPVPQVLNQSPKRIIISPKRKIDHLFIRSVNPVNSELGGNFISGGLIELPEGDSLDISCSQDSNPNLNYALAVDNTDLVNFILFY